MPFTVTPAGHVFWEDSCPLFFQSDIQKQLKTLEPVFHPFPAAGASRAISLRDVPAQNEGEAK